MRGVLLFVGKSNLRGFGPLKVYRGPAGPDEKADSMILDLLQSYDEIFSGLANRKW
jgi:hypothetical protein